MGCGSLLTEKTNLSTKNEDACSKFQKNFLLGGRERESHRLREPAPDTQYLDFCISLSTRVSRKSDSGTIESSNVLVDVST